MADKQRVLYAHSKLACQIDAGLVGYGHILKERRRHPFQPELVRALMHAEVRSHSMAGAMQIVESFAPHGLAGQNIHLRTTGSRGELANLQLNMAFQHKRVDMLLVIADRTQRDGACNVGRSVLVLRATIEQQQSMRFQRDVGLGRGLIVHNGPMGTISGDSVETDVAEQGLLSSQTGEFLVNGYLCLAASLHSGLQPTQELHQGDAILEHGRPITAYLRLVLYGLHGGDGTLVSNHLLHIDQARQGVIGLVRVEQDVILSIFLDTLAHIVVASHLHTLALQMGLNLGRQFLLINI